MTTCIHSQSSDIQSSNNYWHKNINRKRKSIVRRLGIDRRRKWNKKLRKLYKSRKIAKRNKKEAHLKCRKRAKVRLIVTTVIKIPIISLQLTSAKWAKSQASINKILPSIQNRGLKSNKWFSSRILLRKVQLSPIQLLPWNSLKSKKCLSKNSNSLR